MFVTIRISNTRTTLPGIELNLSIFFITLDNNLQNYQKDLINIVHKLCWKNDTKTVESINHNMSKLTNYTNSRKIDSNSDS